MNTLIQRTRLAAGHDSPAEHTRELLRKANVFCVNLVGGPGCGKGTLIDATVIRLAPNVRAGVISCDLTSRVFDRTACHASQVVPLHARDGGAPSPAEVADAVDRLDLSCVDVLFIENVGTLVGPIADDLGQTVTVAVFSVAGGDDKAQKHAELVRQSSVILLNKTDLLSAVPFDLAKFRRDVRRLNAEAPLHELSALRGDGLDAWVQWLGSQQAPGGTARVSKWFG